jgi:Family of unknown function (DUF5522)
MKKVKEKVREKTESKEKFVEGIDFYFEKGLMVLTEHFLKKRGYCCDNNCRHCPYEKTEKAEL